MSTAFTQHTKTPHHKELLLLIPIALFLGIVWYNGEMVWLSYRSLFNALRLFVIDNTQLQAIFSAEIIEFWIASLYVVIAPIVLLAIMFRARTRRQKSKRSDESQSPGKVSMKAFMQNRIAQVASTIIFTLYSTAFLAPFLAPFSPYDQQDFLVTAYQPPFTRVTALVLQEPKNLIIPKQAGSGTGVDIANSVIGDVQHLKNRNQPHAIKYVNSYRIEGDNVLYQQGIRNRTIAKAALLTNSNGNPVIESRIFLLGTDQYGRDILSRVIYGSKISLSIGFLVVLISVTLGTIIGVSSAYFGGWIDAIAMRIVDVLIAFPALFLILIIIATFGNSIYLIVLTLSFTGWMGVARMVRSQVLSLKEQEFILAAQSLGFSTTRIIFRHLVPNSLTPVIIAATLRIGSIILTEAGLSFLGLGVQPPTPSWGNIINEGRDSLLNYWWISTFPGLAILTTVVCFNLIGDGVRDALDPRMRV
uniref:Peptide ABC transporter, permease protein, putative n=1 Tax=Chlorobium chlorochromatii (strain CaD3) TaxID=340177 RepID=Q3ARF6_CHLCH